MMLGARVRSVGSFVVAAAIAGTLQPIWAARADQAGRAAGPPDPRSNVGPADRPRVDPAAAERGRTTWAAECITCHGSQARGGDGGPSLIRSALVMRDRAGSELGPFLKKGHPTQSGKPSASLTDAQVGELMNFVLQRRNDTLRGSALFTVQDILVGDPKAGAAYFSGAGGCATCHSVTGDLAGLAARYANAVDLQQRMVFPNTGGRGGRGRGGAPSRSTVTVTLTPATGAPMSGVLVLIDDLFVTYRDSAGATHVVRRTPTLKVSIDDPLKAHYELLDRITDKNIHDLVAYLWGATK